MQSKHNLFIAPLALAAALAAPGARAQISDGIVKIGVLSDMSSLYSAVGGPGSEVAARMAVEDFGAAKKGMKVEIVSPTTRTSPTSVRRSRASGTTWTRST